MHRVPLTAALCCRCFFNAMLQGLLHMPSFISWLVGTAPLVSSARPLCHQLVGLYNSIVHGGRNGNIAELLQAIWSSGSAADMSLCAQKHGPSLLHLEPSDPQQAYSGLLALLVDKVSCVSTLTPSSHACQLTGRAVECWRACVACRHACCTAAALLVGQAPGAPAQSHAASPLLVGPGHTHDVHAFGQKAAATLPGMPSLVSSPAVVHAVHPVAQVRAATASAPFSCRHLLGRLPP